MIRKRSSRISVVCFAKEAVFFCYYLHCFLERSMLLLRNPNAINNFVEDVGVCVGLNLLPQQRSRVINGHPTISVRVSSKRRTVRNFPLKLLVFFRSARITSDNMDSCGRVDIRLGCFLVVDIVHTLVIVLMTGDVEVYAVLVEKLFEAVLFGEDTGAFADQGR